MKDVFFLSCGHFVAPGFAVRPSGERPRATRLPNTVAVAVRDDDSVVLVDAGWSVAACAAPLREIGLLASALLGVRVMPDDAIASQLRALGIHPLRVQTIVATHLHLDHIGGAADFPNAELVVSQPELEAMLRAPRWKQTGYRAKDLARAGRIRAVALDAGPTYGFPASADVFGDGQVVLLDARGHTRGSAAVALRCVGERVGERVGGAATAAPRTYVHIGDAAYQRWEYGLAPAGPGLLSRALAWSTAELTATYARLRACEADPRRPVVVPSHDGDVFAQLPHAPASAAPAE